jgi:GH24 family phage-related lysozyme (muramidase)
MRTTPAGVALIARNEGYVGHAYKPVPWERFWTYGYGHYGADVRAGATISEPAARNLLATDLRRFEAAVTAALRGAKGLTPSRFSGLVSLAYNCGPGAVTGSIRRYALAGDWEAVYGVMRQYVRAGGHVLPGLVRRRNEEIALMRRGAAAAPARRDPLADLTPTERRWCREYDRLKASNQGLARRRALRSAMLAQRRRVWQAGHGHGWDAHHRRERYHALLARTS